MALGPKMDKTFGNIFIALRKGRCVEDSKTVFREVVRRSFLA